ncbi:MAG: AraC family transcriptional regulator [Cellulosilyticaceae bacterium]
MLREILLRAYPFGDIKPLVCGEETCEKAHAFGPATRDYYLLHYVLSGKGRFRTPRGQYEVGKGQFFVIRPFEVTYYEADQMEPWHYCWVGFESQLDLGYLLCADVMSLPQGEHLFRAMKDSDGLAAGREFYVCAKLYELLGQLEAVGVPQKDQSRVYVEQVQNYISANYMKPITVELLAQKVGLERSYFSRVFRSYIGKSPQQYLVDFRLEKAAELISSHSYTPTRAAQSVGYGDFFNFSKMFKKKFGSAPSQYK